MADMAGGRSVTAAATEVGREAEEGVMEGPQATRGYPGLPPPTRTYRAPTGSGVEVESSICLILLTTKSTESAEHGPRRRIGPVRCWMVGEEERWTNRQ